MTQVEDGTGNSYKARVCDHNRLAVAGVARGYSAWKTLLGKTHLVSTGFMPVTTTEGLMFWFQYTHESRHITIDRVNMFWNGGNTNHNRALKVLFDGGFTSVPTTNEQELTIYNANITSKLVLSADVYGWDGVGSGMTGQAGGGVLLSSNLVSQGATQWNVAGRLLLGPGSIIGILAQGEEAGNMAVTLCVTELDDEDMTP